jgi:hypothetical protein
MVFAECIETTYFMRLFDYWSRYAFVSASGYSTNSTYFTQNTTTTHMQQRCIIQYLAVVDSFIKG